MSHEVRDTRTVDAAEATCIRLANLAAVLRAREEASDGANMVRNKYWDAGVGSVTQCCGWEVSKRSVACQFCFIHRFHMRDVSDV